jgi:DNA-binding Lrp family transcriptional regulator
MKIIVFVLINCEEGAEKAILLELRKMRLVSFADQVVGTYDIIVKIESDMMEELKETITWDIRKMVKIRSTLILTVRNTIRC